MTRTGEQAPGPLPPSSSLRLSSGDHRLPSLPLNTGTGRKTGSTQGALPEPPRKGSNCPPSEARSSPLAATLTLVGGVRLAGALTAGTASAATPSCGPSCVNLYPQEYAGTTLNSPQFVLDVFRQKQAVGQPVILFRAADFDPAEDWTYAAQGTVADFYAAGLVSSAVALHYGCTATVTASLQVPCGTGPGSGVNDQAYEIEYAPFGVDSGLCMGVASAAFSGEGVTLQGCGISSRTVWIQDTFAGDYGTSTASPAPTSSPSGSGECGFGLGCWAAINGSGTDFSNPFVLTYPANAYPTDKPRAQLTVTNLAQFSQGAPVDDTTQLWTAFAGELP